MNYTLVTFLIILTVSSCSKSDDNLFWISDNVGQNSDFLFMAESTNVQKITDSVTYYLTTQEILQAEHVVYKNFGEIYKNSDFKVNIILRIGSKSGRDYSFIVRTLKTNGGVIDSYEFAKWIEQDDTYCFGFISKDLVIDQSCGETRNQRQISNDGHIITISN